MKLFKDYLMERLRNREFAIAYIEESYRESLIDEPDDMDYFLLALKDVVKALETEKK